MSTNGPDHLEFQGRDLKECEHFIAAINKHAQAEGKLWDDQWIAEFVAIRLRGDALIWWSSLEEETQCSWPLLRKAMISRFRPQFHGNSGAEAEDFVYQIRQRALDVGKLNDPDWAAHFASGCFVGGALRWYISLKPGIRNDWDSLQQAIFAHYGHGLKQESPLVTIPKPAPVAVAPDVTRSRFRGRIQIDRKDNSKIHYLSKSLSVGNQAGRLLATPAIFEALEVECESLHSFDTPQTLFIPDGQIHGCDALGVHWSNVETTRGSSFLAICGIQSDSGTGSAGKDFKGPVVTKAWNISQSANNKQTKPVLVTSESGERLVCVSKEGNFRHLWFKTSKDSEEINLELFFEPV